MFNVRIMIFSLLIYEGDWGFKANIFTFNVNEHFIKHENIITETQYQKSNKVKNKKLCTVM